jgi:hypothetical protein
MGCWQCCNQGEEQSLERMAVFFCFFLLGGRRKKNVMKKQEKKGGLVNAVSGLPSFVGFIC